MNNFNWETSTKIHNLIKRSFIIKRIRNFFDKKKFIEVETPILTQFENTSPYLSQFNTNFINNKKKKKLFLITSPEYHMKRILASNINKSIYQICHSFRNEEFGKYHSPEFSILEWYHINYNLSQLMLEVNEFFIKFGFNKLKKYSYKNIFLKYLNINPFHVQQKKILSLIRDIGFVKNNNKDSNQNITHNYIEILFDLYIVPKLGQKNPVIIYHFPSSQKTTETISKKKHLANRFEVFFKGVELGNGFHELNNFLEQKKRFDQDNIKRNLMGLSSKKIDFLFLKSIKYGNIPHCSGMALGLDRFIMFLLKQKSIHKSVSFSIIKS
ncbi:elongation factor P--(R)-beta-lysine ligase [Enterobacteriaceae endosymbiont of Donacia cincticornis]|uniref:elongation factor P--(R)-beta-lysine ligase n=1 Tax=Enterobacteriaceae endosymbiont of Donacia cincticornis TaxID=2675773 RepID=UPI001448EBA2|nr:elongation factor P--(R)-beta-lysine ligase [Enterobacteriaceae endosymbiont of Donacia cincticornis]QJC36064.1 elongation factor P--(R)-beta-lysine ligase [Enterobacteriaceae endosymbiont of Donacia cincticornis]